MLLVLAIIVGCACFLSFAHTYYFSFCRTHYEEMQIHVSIPHVRAYYKRASSISSAITLLLVICEVMLLMRLLGLA